MALKILSLIAYVLVSYLLGSINFAILISKFIAHKDIRKVGSGNAGATNVARTMGIVPGVATFLLDFSKGVIAAYFGGLLFSYLGASMGVEIINQTTGILICGTAAQIGHIYPVFFNFKGGKGISCSAGILLICDWKVFVATAIVFLIAFIPSKIISLASISAASLAPIFIILFTKRVSEWDIYIVVALAVFLGFNAVFKHKDNIKRLLRHEEKPLTFKKKEK